MLSVPQPPQTQPSPPPQRFARTMALGHATFVAVTIGMIVAAYITFDRALHVQTAAALSIGLLNRERLLSGRIASLAARYGLGYNVRPELRRASDAFETTQRQLGAGNRGQSTTVGTQRDAAATNYVNRARRIAALPMHDSALAALSGPLFIAAGGALEETLDTAAGGIAQSADRQTRTLRTLYQILATSSVVTVGLGSFALFGTLRRRIARLVSEAAELSGLATVDPLTGMLNKRSFQARGAIEIQKARRYQRPLSLLVIGADELTAIETAHGEHGGATVMRALTSSVCDGTRVSDLVARVDTEQFAILLPETSREGAQILAERLCRKISTLSVPIDDRLVSCTVSIGVAVAEKDATFLWPTLKRADEALYEARIRGRNRVVVAA